MTREEFKNKLSWMQYDLWRNTVVPSTDTLFMEEMLIAVDYEEIDVGQYLVPMVDVLWARARLESYTGAELRIGR